MKRWIIVCVLAAVFLRLCFDVIWLLNRLYSLNPCDPFLYSHISYRFCNYVGYRLV